MTTLPEADIEPLLAARAAREGISFAEARRLHVMEGVIRRASAAAEDLVLRGGLSLRLLCPDAPRPVEDVDFLARSAFAPEATVAQIEAICARPAEDLVAFTFVDAEVIWAETPFPGVRCRVHADCAGIVDDLQIDVGFSDPMIPPPVRLRMPGTAPSFAAEILCCRAETLLGWKAHGLFDRGQGKWRPKDLFDILLLVTHATLDPAALGEAVGVAFTSRGDSPALMTRLLEGQFGKSPWSHRKWARFRASRPAGQVPEELGAVVDRVSAALGPVVRPLLAGATAR